MGFFSRDSKVKKLVKAGKSGELVEQHLQGEVVVPEIISLLEDKDKHVRDNAEVYIGEGKTTVGEVAREAIERIGKRHYQGSA